MNSDGIIGFSKYKTSKPDEKTSFFYVYELEVDAMKYLVDGVQKIMAFKEKTKK